MNERRKQQIHVDCERRTLKLSVEALLNSAASLILVNRGDDIIYANSRFYEKTGYTADDLKSLKFTDLFEKNEDKEQFRNRTIKRLAGNETIDLPEEYIDLHVIGKDGKAFYVDVYPNVIHYEGEPATIYTAIDKTHQRRSERMLEEFFGYCPVSAFIKDRETRAIRLSKHYETIFKKPIKELLGKTNHELWPKKYADSITAEDNFVFENHKPISVECENNGKYFIATKFPINGEYLGGFLIDITDRKKLENDLKEKNQKYKDLYNVLASMLDTIPEMIWIYDSSKDIKYANRALKEYDLGIDVFETYECMLLPDKPEKFIKIIDINGIDRHLEITKLPLYDEEKNLIGCSGTVRDITLSVKKQKKIMKKLERLEGQTAHETKSAIERLNETISVINERWG